MNPHYTYFLILIASLAGPLAFFTGPSSAYVTGQVLAVGTETDFDDSAFVALENQGFTIFGQVPYADCLVVRTARKSTAIRTEAHARYTIRVPLQHACIHSARQVPACP